MRVLSLCVCVCMCMLVHTYMYLGVSGVLRCYVVKQIIKNVLMFDRNTEPSSARASRSYKNFKGWQTLEEYSSRTYQPLKRNILHSLEMSGYVKLPSTQRNIPEDQNPQHHHCGNLKSDIHFLLDFYRMNYFKILHPTLTILQIQRHNIIIVLLISSMSIEINLLLTELFFWMYAFQS